MRIIYANRPKTPIAVVRKLTSEECEALRRCYVLGEYTRQSDELITTVWQHRWWFACDCRGTGSVPPVLFVERSYGGRFTPELMTDRPPHKKDCPFSQSRIAPQSPLTHALPQRPSLGDLFYRWFGAAKMNLLYPYTAEDLVNKQFASLREVARSTSMGNGRQLYAYMRTHPNDLPKLLETLRKDQTRRRSTGSEENESWGVLLNIVTSITNGKILVGESTLEIPPSQIHMPTGAVEAGGPLVTLIKYTAGDNGTVKPTEVFAHPVYSLRQLVPIDYAHERRTLKTLLALQQNMCTKKDVVVAVRKTLPLQQAHKRGIAFQLHRVGPNGKPARELDVISIDATELLDRLPAESQPDDIVYHLVKKDVPFHQLDSKFYSILFARLLDGVTIAPAAAPALERTASPAASSTS